MYVIVSEYENMMGYGLWTMLGTVLTLLENILTDNEQNLYQILKKPSYITTSSLKNS